MTRSHAGPVTVLRVECLKLRRSPALLVALGAPLGMAALLCLSMLARPQIADSPFWSWSYYFQMTRAFWGVFLLPPLLAALAALCLGVEHRQDNWKLQLVQPVPLASLYRAKFLVLLLLSAASQVVLFGATWLLGRALQLPGSPPPDELLIMLAAIPAALPVLAFQFGLSFHWRSFLFPVGIGVFSHFVSLVSSSVPVAGFRPGYYLPWSFSLRALRVSGSGVEQPLVELAIACTMGLALLWAGQLYFTERGRGRTPRPPAVRRATALRYATAGLALAVTLVLFVGMHLRQGARVDALREQVTRVALPVAETDGERADDFSDLEAFGRAVGNARVVLLGEASHGDGATLALKSRLVRYLHQKKGFDVLVFESGLYDCLRSGEEILQGGDSLAWSERSIFDVWTDSAQVRPLLAYLGESVEEGRPLQLAGFDMQITGEVSRDLLLDDLRDFLQGFRPDLLASDDWPIVARNLAELFADAKSWRVGEPSRHEAALGALARLESALRDGAPDRAEPHRRADFWATNLASLQDLFRFVRALDADDPASIRVAAPIRERAMARNLMWLVENHLPDRRILVWGATSHLSRNRDSIENVSAAGMVPMGQELWEALGERSYVVGFTSFEGQRGLPRTGDQGAPRDIGVAPQNGLDDLLARAGFDVAFLDLRGIPADSWLASPTTARPMGHAPMKARWGAVLDGLFFIRRMTPSTSERG